MKIRAMPVTALLCVCILSACTGALAETTVPQDAAAPTRVTEATMPSATGAAPETTAPEESIEAFDPSVPHLSVYIARESIEIYAYSIAPAGTENWIPLQHTGLACFQENDVHGFYCYDKYAAAYNGEECTNWRIKMEIIPENFKELGMGGNMEYSCRIIEDVELWDGIVMKWLYEPGKGEYAIFEEMQYCDACSADFRKID